MRVELPGFLCVALAVGVSAVAQQPQEGVIGFDDHPRVIEVAGAPASADVVARHASLRDLAYAAPRLGSGEFHTPGPLTESERRQITSPLQAEEREQIGISRMLPEPVGFDLSTQETLPVAGARFGGGLFERNLGNLVWTAAFESPGAGAVRLKLEQLSLPEGTVAFAYSRTGEVHGPYAVGGVRREPVWSNTVFSSVVYLEVRFPAGDVDLSKARLSVGSIAHLEHARFAPAATAKSSTEALPDCFHDVNCSSSAELSGVGDATRAAALMVFERNGSVYSCSGALVNTAVGNVKPYFLTANHCVNSDASAKSVELFWDYRTASCGAPAPDRSGFERTLGATLLATGSSENGKPDYSLLLLSQAPPAGRFYLGFSSAPVATSGGATIYRIAHPDGGPQMLSKHAVSALPTPAECSGLPQGKFIYSKNQVGATTKGSSGGPVFLADGLKIVGQLYGRCGNNLLDTCDATQNSAVDGALASYFPEVEYWLAPSGPTECISGARNLCLLGSRFKVELTARDQRSGAVGAGMAIAQNDVFGYFSLPELTEQPENPEVFVKILDGRPVSGKFWVFYGGLTDLEYTIKVTDTLTGIVKSYSKVAGSFCGNADTRAF